MSKNNLVNNLYDKVSRLNQFELCQFLDSVDQNLLVKLYNSLFSLIKEKHPRKNKRTIRSLLDKLLYSEEYNDQCEPEYDIYPENYITIHIENLYELCEEIIDKNLKNKSEFEVESYINSGSYEMFNDYYNTNLKIVVDGQWTLWL